MNDLSNLLTELESYISEYDKINKAVSMSSVGWHIEHSLLTLIVIIRALEDSKTQNYKWKFNLARTIVYAINKIPRGRAKAPKVV